MEEIITTNCLTKKYGKQLALDNVSVHIKKGEIYGLIGKNGAGKTTLLKILSNITVPTSGEATIMGMNLVEAKNNGIRIGSLIEDPGIYPNFSARENMMIKAKLLGLRDYSQIGELLDMVGLSNVGKKKAGKFSLGMRQRLGLAMTILGKPDIALLDEPINGLDPEGIVEMRQAFLRISHEMGITIVISSHILEELSKIANTYGIIDHGVLMKEITTKELYNDLKHKVEIETPDSSQTSIVLESMGIGDYKVLPDNVIHIYRNIEDLTELSLKLASENIPLLRMKDNSESIEDYYMNLLGGERNA